IRFHCRQHANHTQGHFGPVGRNPAAAKPPPKVRFCRNGGNKPGPSPITSPVPNHKETSAMSDHDHHDDGVSRRRVLECMTWAGTGVPWTISGGVPHLLGLVGPAAAVELTGL